MEMTQIQTAVAWADIIITDILCGLKDMGLTFLMMIGVMLGFWAIKSLIRRVKERGRK